MREIFPNVLPVLIALVSLEMGIAVIVEAILLFRRPLRLLGHADLGRHDRAGTAVHASRAVDPRGAAHHAVPDRARLQPARRRPAPRARSGDAAMSEPILAVHGLSAISRARPHADPARRLAHRRARRNARPRRRKRRRQDRRSARRSWAFCRAPSGSLAARSVRGQDLLTMPAAALRRLIGERIALIPQDPMTALNPGRRIEGAAHRRPAAVARTATARAARKIALQAAGRSAYSRARAGARGAIRMNFPEACASAC